MNVVFGTKLRELRKDNGLTQLQLAKIFHVSKTTICQWETQKQEPSLEDLKRIALFFKVTSDFLIGLEDESGRKIYNIQNNINYNYGNVNKF